MGRCILPNTLPSDRGGGFGGGGKGPAKRRSRTNRDKKREGLERWGDSMRWRDSNGAEALRKL
jgi:hypothetical protein